MVRNKSEQRLKKHIHSFVWSQSQNGLRGPWSYQDTSGQADGQEPNVHCNRCSQASCRAGRTCYKSDRLERTASISPFMIVHLDGSHFEWKTFNKKMTMNSAKQHLKLSGSIKTVCQGDRHANTGHFCLYYNCRGREAGNLVVICSKGPQSKAKAART